MREKFNPKDIKFIITCLLIGVASTFFALSYFRQAFPEASINLKKMHVNEIFTQSGDDSFNLKEFILSDYEKL